MDSEDKFWLSCWIVAGLVLMTIIIGITTYNVNQMQVIQRMVENGADPILAGCSVGNVSGSVAAICATRASVL